MQPIADRMVRQRQLLFSYIAALSGEEQERKRPGDNYSAREVLMHLAGAERGMTRLGELMAAGKEPRLPPEYSNDYYNARQVEKRRATATSALEEEMAGARRSLLAFMDGVTEADLEKRGEHPRVGDTDLWGLFNVIVDHEDTHIAELGAWVEAILRERELTT